MFCTWLKWWTQLRITAISPGRSPHWLMKSHSYLISRQSFFLKTKKRTKTVKYIVWFYYRSVRCSYQGFEDHRKITMRARLNEFSKCSWKASRRKLQRKALIILAICNADNILRNTLVLSACQLSLYSGHKATAKSLNICAWKLTSRKTLFSGELCSTD